MDSCRSIEDFSPLSALSSLKYLDLSFCGVIDISWVSNMRSLVKLWLPGCRSIVDIYPLLPLSSSLRDLNLNSCSSLDPVRSPLVIGQLLLLKTLNLCNWQAAPLDVSIFSNLHHLEHLFLSNSSLTHSELGSQALLALRHRLVYVPL